MNKMISASLLTAALVSSAVRADLATAPFVSSDTVKIMCIGDSITDGYVPEYVGSYRKFIYHGLTEKGYTVDMVGAKDGGWTPTYTDEETGESFEFDNENTGYSGYAIKEYSGRSGILETLQSTGCLASAPDIVTLQIGTNDVIDNHEIDNAGERLTVLVEYILANIPDDSALFVTTIPDLDPNRSGVYDWFGNYRHSADWQTQYSDEDAEKAVHASIESYNFQVRKVVEAEKAKGANIYFADVNSVVTDVKTQLFDGVHPNNSGYKLMGGYWTDIISGYLGGSSDIPDIPENKPFTSSELERMSRYLLGDRDIVPDENELIRFDTDGSGSVDVYDLILARTSVI